MAKVNNKKKGIAIDFLMEEIKDLRTENQKLKEELEQTRQAVIILTQQLSNNIPVEKTITDPRLVDPWYPGYPLSPFIY